MIALENCPFCNEPQDGPSGLNMYEGYYTGEYRVECNVCRVRDTDTEERAIAKWNRRAPRKELIEFIQEHRRWALPIFGEGLRTKSITNHIRKELGEIETEPFFLEEWVDVLILALEGAWRTGATEEEIVAALWSKLRIIQKRTYILPADEDAPMEHDRTHDKEGQQ